MASQMKKVMSIKLLYLAVMTLCSVHLTFSFECAPCVKQLCEASRIANCKGGLAIDNCGCCQVCARVEAETCGGHMGEYGKCDKKLECRIAQELGALVDVGSGIGVCIKQGTGLSGSSNNRAGAAHDLTETKCSKVKCPVMFEPPVCPGDSEVVLPPPLPGKCCPAPPRCECRSECPPEPPCPAGGSHKLIRRGSRVPGQCCDVLVCPLHDADNSCDDVTCPDDAGDAVPVGSGHSADADEDALCPPDSVMEPAGVTHGGCCPVAARCRCRTESCLQPMCPDGLQVTVTKKGTGRPGNCCDDFTCTNVTGPVCEDRSSGTGRIYPSGSEWRPDNCTTCRCGAGVKVCHFETCAPLNHCDWVGIEPGECCPRCHGCLASSGRFVLEGSEWLEDECTKCWCSEGRASCIAESCSVSCLHPRRVPGQCCPVCQEPDVVTVPAHCPSTQNCSLMCERGYTRDHTGCFLCQCKLGDCDLTCPHGFEEDADGNEVCRCRLIMNQRCPLLDQCTKQCPLGRERDERGCNMCECRRCPTFRCAKVCPFGFQQNPRGCRLCKCRAIPDVTSHETLLTTASPTFVPEVTSNPDLEIEGSACLSESGRLYGDGETWHDGCRTCYCQDGSEMCNVVSCPVTRCRHPLIRAGDCCPSCPGHVIPAPSLPDEGKRHPAAGESLTCTVGGKLYVEGETFRLDKCTRCLCQRGSVLCEPQRCPPVLCGKPITPPGRCCPVCPHTVDGKPPPDVPGISGSAAHKACVLDTGERHAPGAVWQPSPCLSCTCRAGQVHCFSQVCPPAPPGCNSTLVLKGRCCSHCQEPEKAEDATACKDGAETYAAGEAWESGRCGRCVCVKGEARCHRMTCAPHPCGEGQQPLTVPGFCCPVCRQVNTTAGADGSLGPKSGGDDAKDAGSEAKMHTVVIIGLVVILLVFIVIIIILVVVIRQQRILQRLTKRAKPAPSMNGSGPNRDPSSTPLVTSELNTAERENCNNHKEEETKRML